MEMRLKWNKKYNERISQQYNDQAPNQRLKNLTPYLTGSSALDLACGLGANSLFLASIGYQVQAIDISDVAVDYLSEQSYKKKLDINVYLADLTDLNVLNIADSSLDLVISTYYLDRLVFPFVKSAIKENGYFFMETFYMSPKSRSEVSNNYKLHPGELLTTFGEWQILYYEENEHEGRQTLFARKKTIK